MRVAALLVAVLLGAAVAHAKRGGVLEPVPTAAHMRFAQQHQQQRVGSEAPDWWHYVAPWWSPPEHAATKSPPDFVTETNAFKHFAEPPENTMPVYVPYGRDAMSSFVETATRVRAYGPQTAALARQRMASEQAFMPPQPSPQALMAQYMSAPAAAPQRPLYAGVDTGFGPLPTAGTRYPMPRFEQTQQHAQQQQVQGAAAGAAAGAGVAAGAPPTMPSFPAVPQLDEAANEFSLPSILQLNSPYEAMLKRALHPEQAQAQAQAQQYGAQPYGGPQSPADAMRFEADAKQSEAMEDARWAQMADDEFGAHARAAQAGGQVPRIWRTDRQSDSDMAEEREFEAAAPSDAEAEADAQDAQEARAPDAAFDDGEAAAADMQFRQRTDTGRERTGGVHSAALSDAERAADAEADAADEQALAALDRRDESGLAQAQQLRAASAAQFADEHESAADAAGADAAALDAPYSAFRFQQIGDDEEESSDSDAEADAELDEELDEEEEAEEEARQAAAAVQHHDAEADGEAEESEADAEADVDALLEREADAMEAASDRRIRL